MARKKQQAAGFEGRWHIVSMSEWDEDFINAEEQGYIEFKGPPHSPRAESLRPVNDAGPSSCAPARRLVSSLTLITTEGGNPFSGKGPGTPGPKQGRRCRAPASAACPGRASPAGRRPPR